MATAYTSADYLASANACRSALDRGVHVGAADLVKVISLLEDASNNIVGIAPIASDVVIDGTPAIPDPLAGDPS